MNVNRRLSILLSLLLLTSCEDKRHPVSGFDRQDGLPSADYDAKFSCEVGCGISPVADALDTNDGWNQCGAWIFDTTILRLHGKDLTVSIDGIPFRDSVIRGLHYLLMVHENIHLPHSSTCSVRGVGFPNFTHSLPLLNSVRIISPTQGKAIDAKRPFEFLYSAPGCDSITLHVSFQGLGLMRRDSVNQTPYETGQSSYTQIANTGKYMIPALHLDSSRWRFLNPERVFVDISYSRNDTMHIEDKIIGFVNKAYAPTMYKIKQN